MKNVDLRTLVLPTQVRHVVLQLLANIEVAESIQALRLAAERAEGFVLGLETAGAFPRDQLEMLYIGFDQVMQRQLGHITAE